MTTLIGSKITFGKIKLASLRLDVSLMRKKFRFPRYFLILAPGMLESGVTFMACPSSEAVSKEKIARS
jgi:hypothetical protein